MSISFTGRHPARSRRGIPSMRHIVTFQFLALSGDRLGIDEESKKMMGDFQWGDVHHPPSQTNSKTTAAVVR
jgi:nitrous oxide reductase